MKKYLFEMLHLVIAPACVSTTLLNSILSNQK